jgi:predicted restriction endonuclease
MPNSKDLQKRRERNRVLAQKSRSRKRNEIAVLRGFLESMYDLARGRKTVSSFLILKLVGDVNQSLANEKIQKSTVGWVHDMVGTDTGEHTAYTIEIK